MLSDSSHNHISPKVVVPSYWRKVNKHCECSFCVCVAFASFCDHNYDPNAVVPNAFYFFKSRFIFYFISEIACSQVLEKVMTLL